jgi:peptidoglycan hydrolase-like protein with peptidoglycan-binding domain
MSNNTMSNNTMSKELVKLPALIHPALAAQSSEQPLKLKQFKLQTPKLSSVIQKRFVWKSLLFLTTIAAGLSIAPKAFAALHVGDTGREVRNLQKALGISTDGIYGTQTEQAVTRYQRSCGLEVDGIAGTSTLSSIAAGDCIASGGYRPIYPGGGFLPIQPGDQSGGQSGGRGGPYTVVVPGSSSDRLAAVQQIVPEASRDNARGERGEFINAGGYGTRSAAERISNRLKDIGLPARVDFRP